MNLSNNQLNDICKSILITEEREGNYTSTIKPSSISGKFSDIASKKKNSSGINVLSVPPSRNEHKQQGHAFSNNIQLGVLSSQNLATSNKFKSAKKMNKPLSNLGQTKQEMPTEKCKGKKRKKNIKCTIDKKAKKSSEVCNGEYIANKINKPKVEKIQQVTLSDSDFDEISIESGETTDKIIQAIKCFSDSSSEDIENVELQAQQQKSFDLNDVSDETSLDSSPSTNDDIQYLSSSKMALTLNDEGAPLDDNSDCEQHYNMFLKNTKCIKAFNCAKTFSLTDFQNDEFEDESQLHMKSLDTNLNEKVTKIKVFESLLPGEDFASSSSSTQDSFENVPITEGTSQNGFEENICTNEMHNDSSIINPNTEPITLEPFEHQMKIGQKYTEECVIDNDIDRSPSQENSIDEQIGNASINTELDTRSIPTFAIFENSNKTNDVLALLKSGIEFYGTVTVTLLCGQIDINGYQPIPLKPFTIYSPRGFSSVQIWPINSKPEKCILHREELETKFTKAQLDNIISNYDKRKNAVVMLQRNSGAQHIINTFSKHMAENVFPQVKTLSTARPHYTSECLLQCLINGAFGPSVFVPQAWNKIELQSNSRIMITGGKSVGKSTMLRYLSNRTLSRFSEILLIDLDIGQPELFVPQTISCSLIGNPFLGPGFFLNKQPDRAYVVGHVNVVMCPEQYARAVRQLLEYCEKNSNYKKIPWLVNTMGYNKGFGLELMRLVIGYVNPTDVIQLSSQKHINNFDELLQSETLSKLKPIIYTAHEFKMRKLRQYSLHLIDSAVTPNVNNQQIWMMSAKEIRYATLLTRLSATLKGNAEWLTSCQPVVVSLNALKILHLTSTEYSRDELIAGMDANIVYLCQQNMPADEVQPECIGIGVVRAIDYKNGKLYLVPAMNNAYLTRVNCLVVGGDLTLPQAYYKDQGPGVANNVPFVFIIDDTNFSKSIKQIYHRAPEFLGGLKH